VDNSLYFEIQDYLRQQKYIQSDRDFSEFMGKSKKYISMIRSSGRSITPSVALSLARNLKQKSDITREYGGDHQLPVAEKLNAYSSQVVEQLLRPQEI